VLPKDFHRIRHYGLFANTNRVADIARARELLGAAPPAKDPGEQKAVELGEPRVLPCPCPHCGGRMIVIEVFARGCEPRYRPALHATTRPVVRTTLDVLHWIEVTIAAVDSPREKSAQCRPGSIGRDPAVFLSNCVDNGHDVLAFDLSYCEQLIGCQYLAR
jgi:hypothetical protein